MPYDALTPAGNLLMERWFGDREHQVERQRMRMEVGVELVEDPLAPAEALIETLATAELGRPLAPPKLLPQGDVGVHKGQVTFKGRACCHDFLTSWNDELHKLRLPTTLECPTCHARYRLGWKVPTRR